VRLNFAAGGTAVSLSRAPGYTQSLPHDANHLRILVSHNKLPPVPQRRLTGCAAAAEEVQHGVAGVGMHAHDALQNRQRFLRRATAANAPMAANQPSPL